MKLGKPFRFPAIIPRSGRHICGGLVATREIKFDF